MQTNMRIKYVDDIRHPNHFVVFVKTCEVFILHTIRRFARIGKL